MKKRINRQFSPGTRSESIFQKATSAMKPSMIPNAVHICHIMASAPQMNGGAYSIDIL